MAIGQEMTELRQLQQQIIHSEKLATLEGIDPSESLSVFGECYLRDAMRRFSIDSDRVFLSGHSIGGDAAWDIGLAHPDLWAGVIPIVVRSRT